MEIWILRSQELPKVRAEADRLAQVAQPVADPIEVAAGNDIVAYRRRFGRQMAYRGGVDKRALAAGPAAIDAALEQKVRPLLAQSGYFPMLDHYAPPDISFENYMYYRIRLKQLRTAE